MNMDIFWDKLTAGVASATLGKQRFFSESLESMGYAKHLEQIKLDITEITEGIHEVTAETATAEIDPAFYLMQWKGKDYPTIIYHHGNNERPFDFSRFAKNSFKNIFCDAKTPTEANLIAIRAPFHNDSLKSYQKVVGHLSNFVAMLSTSVKLIEHILQQLKKEAEAPILVSGISLGGWVTNLHRTYYNTADAYVPLLAGAALDHLFTDSIYRKMGGRIARGNPARIREILNFEEDFQKIKDDNVFPLLGQYDQFIQYERQRKSYKTDNIKVLKTGHVTSFLSGKELRNHILSITRQIS
jgi:hypothetical protein